MTSPALAILCDDRCRRATPGCRTTRRRSWPASRSASACGRLVRALCWPTAGKPVSATITLADRARPGRRSATPAGSRALGDERFDMRTACRRGIRPKPPCPAACPQSASGHDGCHASATSGAGGPRAPAPRNLCLRWRALALKCVADNRGPATFCYLPPNRENDVAVMTAPASNATFSMTTLPAVKCPVPLIGWASIRPMPFTFAREKRPKDLLSSRARRGTALDYHTIPVTPKTEFRTLVSGRSGDGLVARCRARTRLAA